MYAEANVLSDLAHKRVESVVDAMSRFGRCLHIIDAELSRRLANCALLDGALRQVTLVTYHCKRMAVNNVEAEL